MMEYDQGPPAPSGPQSMAGFGAYEASELPPILGAPQAQTPPTSVMMVPPTERPRGYGDGPLMDTTQSVSFPLPDRQEAPVFQALAASPPQAAAGPYRGGASFPARRGARPRGLGEPPARTSAMLGLSLLAVGVGAAIGAKYAGMFGGIAGGLYGGAAINAIRAVKNLTDGQPSSDREAAISGTYSVIGAGVATYVLYQTRAEKKKG